MDEDIDGPQGGNRLGHEPFRLGAHADVGLDGQGTVALSLQAGDQRSGQLSVLPVVDGDRGPQAGEAPSDDGTQAA